MTPIDDRVPRRPRVVAHRGSSDEVAEHTLAAYRRALADGADALECDVRLTRDGHLVCLHDRRVERTSDGKGVVSTKRLTQLRDLDWSSWKGDAEHLEGPEPSDPGDLTVLTLRDLLAMARDHAGPVEVVVETKHPTRYSGWVERRLVELLREFGWDAPDAATGLSPVVVVSDSLLSLRRMRRRAPGVPLGWVLEDGLPASVRRCELPRGVSHVVVSTALVYEYPAWVQHMRQSGHGVYVWVVNDGDALRRCRALGVDAVITDRPRFARAVLDGDPREDPRG